MRGLGGGAAVLRAVLATSGRAVRPRVLALWGALGIAATILFGGNGLDARVVTRAFHAFPVTRAALALGWIALATPVVSGAFDAPGTRVLRASGVPRAAWVAALLALVLAVQLPCGALFSRGDGAATAVVEVLLAAATEAALVAAARRPRYALAAAAALALVVLDLRAPVAAAPALAVAWVGVRGAWSAALDGSGLDVRMTRPGPPVVVLALAHWLRLARAARSRLVVATASVSLGGLATALSLHNDPPARPAWRALTVLSLPLALAAAVLVGPLRQTEDHVRALARVTRTRWTTLFAAFALALVAPSSALAATAGAVAGHTAGLPAVPIGGAAGAWAAPVACAVAAWARWHDGRARRSPVRFVLGVMAVAAVATGVAAAW